MITLFSRILIHDVRDVVLNHVSCDALGSSIGFDPSDVVRVPLSEINPSSSILIIALSQDCGSSILICDSPCLSFAVLCNALLLSPG
jgi:hypothetical protein